MVEVFEKNINDEFDEISDVELLVCILTIPNFYNCNYVKNRLIKIILDRLLNDIQIQNDIIMYPIETN